MAKLFVGYVVDRLLRLPIKALIADNVSSGLAWHTDDGALRAKFEEFGPVEEAVRSNLLVAIDCI